VGPMPVDGRHLILDSGMGGRAGQDTARRTELLVQGRMESPRGSKNSRDSRLAGKN
jgi:hypothetical protein